MVEPVSLTSLGISISFALFYALRKLFKHNTQSSCGLTIDHASIIENKITETKDEIIKELLQALKNHQT